MADLIRIICPECGFHKDIEKGRIPEGASRVTCPKCKQLFNLTGDAPPAAVPPALEIPSAPPSPPVPPVAAPRPPARPRLLSFSFSGSVRDYFGIWIVNTLLKLVTCGAYSAWAKVRKRRFFYGSTRLEGEPFDYLADPMALFKGWLLAAGAFLLYLLGTKVSPVLSAVIGLAVFAAYPWLVVRSRMFNAVNSSYRNIRFGFKPDYSQAYLVYAALPFFTLATLGFLIPYTLFRQRKFMVENSSYGAAPFVFTASAKDFYIVALRIVLVVIAMAVSIGTLFFLAGGSMLHAAAAAGRLAPNGIAVAALCLGVMSYFFIVVFARTELSNLGWNSTALAGSCFRSTLRTRDMALLFITNALAILFSFGLLMPWASVRLTRYRFDNLTLLADAGLDSVVAAHGKAGVSAAGEEIGDVFGMSVDIAL